MGRVSRHLLADATRVVSRLPLVDRWRSLGPEASTRLAREIGRRAPLRSAKQQAQLRAVIAFFDRLCGPNCYRRVLLELSLDREAAADPVFFGIRRSCDGGPGHVWRGVEPSLEAQYEAVFSFAQVS